MPLRVRVDTFRQRLDAAQIGDRPAEGPGAGHARRLAHGDVRRGVAAEQPVDRGLQIGVGIVHDVRVGGVSPDGRERQRKRSQYLPAGERQRRDGTDQRHAASVPPGRTRCHETPEKWDQRTPNDVCAMIAPF
jgi:hypothetical protein